MHRSAVHSSLCILLAPCFNLATIRFATVASSRKAALSRFVGGVNCNNHDDYTVTCKSCYLVDCVCMELDTLPIINS